MPKPDAVLPALPDPRDWTPTQRAAVLFVAALAENVDERQGILATNGTPETRARVAAHVKRTFFTPKEIDNEPK